MKKLIGLILGVGLLSHAGQITQTTAETQTLLDWVDGVSTNVAATNAVTALDNALWHGLAELSIPEASSQDFTGGAFQAITNLEQNVADTGFTTTHSNITISATGRYTIWATASWDTATLSEVEAHFFTNSVTLLDSVGNETGWKRTQGAGGADGVAACHKTVSLVAGSKISFRYKFTDNETATFHYATITVEKR